MKVLICSSETLTDYDFLKKHCSSIIVKEQFRVVEKIEIVSFDSDSLVEQLCKEYKLQNKSFIVEWKNLEDFPLFIKINKFGQYNSLAPLNRNTKMIKYISDSNDNICIAFDAETKDVKDIVRKSKKAGIKTFQIKCENLENYKIKVWNE